MVHRNGVGDIPRFATAKDTTMINVKHVCYGSYIDRNCSEQDYGR